MQREPTVELFERLYASLGRPVVSVGNGRPRPAPADQRSRGQPALQGQPAFRGQPALCEDRLPLGPGISGGLFWCPDGMPEGETVSLLSSRIGRSAVEDPQITTPIRTFLNSIGPHQILVTSQGVSLELPMKRGASLLGIPIACLLPFPRQLTLAELRRLARPSGVSQAFRVFYDRRRHPCRDRLLLESCQQPRILAVRRNGNLHRVLCETADRRRSPPLLLDSANTPPQLRQELRAVGCQDWLILPNAAARNVQPRATNRNLAPLVPFEDLDACYLSHWTRGCSGSGRRGLADRWDQALRGESVLRGPLATLCQILRQQTIVAGGALIRGGQPMCCFTQVPLAEFGQRRVFRQHLSRWDFEPWGIAIEASALQRCGARPVTYRRPNQRPVRSRQTEAWTVADDESGRWSAEREWRIAGSLDLREVGVEEAVVFTGNPGGAEICRRISRWPVTILPRAASRGTRKRSARRRPHSLASIA